MVAVEFLRRTCCRNSFNIFRAYVHLFGQAAPLKLVRWGESYHRQGQEALAACLKAMPT